MVISRLRKSKLSELEGELYISLTRGLLQPTEGLLEFAYEAKLGRITHRQLHVHIFIQTTVQEGAVDVHLL